MNHVLDHYSDQHWLVQKSGGPSCGSVFIFEGEMSE